MKKYIMLSLVTLIFSCLVILAMKNKIAEKITREVNSREYQMMLKESKFVAREKGFKEYWSLVKRLAKKHGVKVVEDSKPFKEKQREVVFYDTKDFDLQKFNYSLRKRTNYKKNKRQKTYEISLKFRSNNKGVAAKADVSLTKRFTPDIEFEEDLKIKQGYPSELNSVFSLRNRIKNINIELKNSIAGFANIFPCLLKLGLKSDAELLIVNNTVIDERRIQPGVLYFGEGLKVKVDITVWLKNKKPFLAEFSYDHKVDNKSKNTMIACEKFFKALYKATPDWVADGSSKTAKIYEIQ